MKKVCHLTSVHPINDVRIFLKECLSLVNSGFDVTIIACGDNFFEDIKDGIKRISLCVPIKNRLQRVIKRSYAIYKRALEVNADIYHLHDPELILVGLFLKSTGKTIIFDAHEDVARQILNKPYLTPIFLRLLSGVFSIFERYAYPQFNGIIAATPFIRDKLISINPNTVDIENFPIIGELDAPVPWLEKRNEICYVGGISSIRGIREIVRACEFLKSPARLNLAGSFFEPAVKDEVKFYLGWSRVNEYGFLNRDKVREVLRRSMAGLVTLHPTINYIDALAVKMFEYMSAGIPVIASNFPLWRKIIEDNSCGICVNPLNPEEIANAIDFLVMNPDIASYMGENGRQAVLNKYNWSAEEEKLRSFYTELT